MKRRRTQQYGMGRVFKRRSRHTGKLLPTWWIAYSVDGARVRESANTEDRQAALNILRERRQGRVGTKRRARQISLDGGPPLAVMSSQEGHEHARID